MKTLEEFFKNRALFKNVTTFNNILRFSNRKNIYNPEDYSLDFLKEKVKPCCYCLFSFLGEPRPLIVIICVNDLENSNGLFWCEKIIVVIEYLWDTRNSFFYRKLKNVLTSKKQIFATKYLVNPFLLLLKK